MLPGVLSSPATGRCRESIACTPSLLRVAPQGLVLLMDNQGERGKGDQKNCGWREVHTLIFLRPLNFLFGNAKPLAVADV